MNKIIITTISLLFMYGHLKADVIKYKKPNSLDEFTLSNIKILKSDAKFVYYKNNVSFNSNKILCSQIIEINDESGNIIQTSCNAKSINLNSNKKEAVPILNDNDMDDSNLTKSKSNSILHNKQSKQSPEEIIQTNEIDGKNISRNINLLLMGLIVFFIFFKLKEQ